MTHFYRFQLKCHLSFPHLKQGHSECQHGVFEVTRLFAIHHCNYSQRAEIEESRGKLDHYLKCSIAAGHQSCDTLLGRRTSDDVFLVSLSSFSENLCMHRHGNPVLSALWHHISPHPFSIWWLSVRTSKVVLIVLMIMCHSDVSHVRPRAGCQPEAKETQQASVVLCWSKWLMTLSVVVLWLRLQWFIATAHNAIRLHIYTPQNSVVLLYDPTSCVHALVCYLLSCVYINVSQVCLMRFPGRKNRLPSALNFVLKSKRICT